MSHEMTGAAGTSLSGFDSGRKILRLRPLELAREGLAIPRGAWGNRIIMRDVNLLGISGA